MPIRFQADADLNQVIVSAVARRVPAIDFRTASSAGLAGLDDQEVLALATRDGRVLVTHDRATMPRHFHEFLHSQRSSGLIVIPQYLPIREAADDRILIWAATQVEEWTNRIVSYRSDPGRESDATTNAAAIEGDGEEPAGGPARSAARRSRRAANISRMAPVI